MESENHRREENAPEGVLARMGRGRLVLAAAGWLAAAVFVYWYLTAPGRQEIKKRPRASVDDIVRPVPVGDPSLRNLKYPSMDEPAPKSGTADDYEPWDPHARLPYTRANRPRDLFALIPNDVSVVAALNLSELRQTPWFGPVLNGQRLGVLAAAADMMGVDLTEARRIAAALKIRSALGMGLKNVLAGWSRWRRALKRPLCIVVETAQSRASALKLFRKYGPLRAAVVMGRRVYRRAPGFSMAVPDPGLLMATYLRPVAALVALATGRSRSSVRSSEADWLLREIAELTEGAPAVTVLSRLWNNRTGKPQPTKVPGGGKMLAAAFSARVDKKGVHLLWLVRLDSQKGAARLATRIKWYVKKLARVSWVKRTRLARGLVELKIKAASSRVSAHLFLTHEACANLLEFAERQ